MVSTRGGARTNPEDVLDDARSAPRRTNATTRGRNVDEFSKSGGGEETSSDARASDDDGERASDEDSDDGDVTEESDDDSASDAVEDALAKRIRASAEKRASGTRAEEEDATDDGSDDASESAEDDDNSDSKSDSDASASVSVSASASDSDSDSNAKEEDLWRRADDPVLNDVMVYYLAQSMHAECELEEYRQRVSDPNFEPTKEDYEFVDAMRKAVVKTYTLPLPTLESEAKAQQERLRKEAGGIDGALPRERADVLDAMPTDGWNRERKKERVKMKANDPSAQGKAYETRKLIEEGAGLFVAPMDQTKVRREMKKMERKTAGKGWFDMKAVEYTPEMRREMRMLKLRGAYDPKRFYKNADTTRLPTHFQIGTVIGGAADWHSARLAKRDQKQTLAEEILADKDIERVRRNRFAKIQEKNAGNMGRKAKRRLGGRDRGKSKRPKI